MLQQQQPPKECEMVGVMEAAAIATAATADAATTNPNGASYTYRQYNIKKLQTTHKNH